MDQALPLISGLGITGFHRQTRSSGFRHPGMRLEDRDTAAPGPWPDDTQGVPGTYDMCHCGGSRTLAHSQGHRPQLDGQAPSGRTLRGRTLRRVGSLRTILTVTALANTRGLP